MKITKLLVISLIIMGMAFLSVNYFTVEKEIAYKQIPEKKEKKKKEEKSLEDRRRFAEERLKHEIKFQKNPNTGRIPETEKLKEIEISKSIRQKNSAKSSTTTYISRGPSNLGGRTRSLVIDVSDPTSNTIISGGVSGGVFRTTDGGLSWTKVSANNEIHNVTSIAQDPRDGFQNIWYYSTGEFSGNSARLGGSPYLGQGIWQSTDGGITWAQLPSTASEQTSDDSPFDFIHKLEVHPATGDLYAATRGAIRRYDGTVWTTELDASRDTFSDVIITSTGKVFAGLAGNSGDTFEGVWESATGIGSWSRIAGNGTPSNWNSTGRLVLAVAPSNENRLYAMYVTSGGFYEVDLWQFEDDVDTWTNRSIKLPDEPGGDSPGNDPIAVQGGYDLVMAVKPDNENFVVIGGTNAYKIEDIVTETTFTRIGGYRDNTGYGLYDLGVNGDRHHPDIHALVFDPQNPDILFTGTDGGVHKTIDVNVETVAWVNLNNNYQTYQYYHVAIDPDPSSNIVIGGAQDNGTTAGGFSSSPDLTTMVTVFGGDGVAVGVSRDDACVPFFEGSQNGNIYRDCPDGLTITPDGSNSQFVTYFYLDPSSNNALYYAGRTDLYKTTQSTTVTPSTWEELGTLASGGGVLNEWIVRFGTTWGTYNPSSSYLLIGGDTGSVLRLDDPQNATSLTNAVDITPAAVTRAFPTVVTGLAIHPTNPDIVMLTYSNYGITNIFITTNATAATPTWEIAERNLDAFSIRSAAIAEVEGETIYFVGTARGLYSSADPINEDWSIEAPDQIGYALISSLAYRPDDNKLLVGTHGNGMYIGTVNTTLSVEEFNTTDTEIIAYPVPATNELNIVLENTFIEGDLVYKIFDLNGREIKNGILSEEKKVNLQNLNSGLYVLQLQSNARTKSITFIKR
ncbi:T9SS type A sorting domain-containing protein [Aquimarina brevivitae]|uniref:Putative secreted protein (Por secretion system target) n=1 Tax=Aquimarina brevivitae TaxID=323412 RepID=A0A4Q7PG61_9FLAO|nr:T9SS type A sorting domain-containing protein [Aquimarina brevivitae]RZS99345.1 putative secreted protein (Por secretion system target) [Aquimarina brevivitae]